MATPQVKGGVVGGAGSDGAADADTGRGRAIGNVVVGRRRMEAGGVTAAAVRAAVDRRRAERGWVNEWGEMGVWPEGLHLASPALSCTAHRLPWWRVAAWAGWEVKAAAARGAAREKKRPAKVNVPRRKTRFLFNRDNCMKKVCVTSCTGVKKGLRFHYVSMDWSREGFDGWHDRKKDVIFYRMVAAQHSRLPKKKRSWVKASRRTRLRKENGWKKKVG